ncbi:MAG: B12-binding domain-containing protein [Candidatus Methanomethylicus sp.]|nr:B12-binding domain-containing protein [Candidatus Methanomethylicus sp.]
MSNEKLKKLKEMIVNQDSDDAVEITKQCLSEGYDPREIIDTISNGLKEVGDLFEKKELFLPEVMRAANAAKNSLKLAIPFVRPSPDGKTAGKIRVAMGSPGPHDIGKTIITAMLIAGGFEVIDLGIMLTPEKAEKMLQDAGGAKVLGLSVLLTSDTRKAAEIIKRIRTYDKSLKVMVGGVAMNPKVAAEINADAYGKDANAAVKLARELGGQ